MTDCLRFGCFTRIWLWRKCNKRSFSSMHKRHMWDGDCCYNMLCSRTIRKHLRQTSTFDISQQKGLMEIILILPEFSWCVRIIMTLPLLLGNIIRHSKLFILSVSLLCMQPPALSQTPDPPLFIDSDFVWDRGVAPGPVWFSWTTGSRRETMNLILSLKILN